MALNLLQSKSDLAERIKRFLGEPAVKVELATQQIYDSIDLAKQKWIKWAAGNATVETYFTVLLLANQNFYDLPLGVMDVIEYDDKGSDYGINTLFTIDNFLFSRGAYNPLVWSGGNGYSMISYHMAKDFLETVDRYTPSIYNYKYHKYTNQLEVQPAPPSGNALDVIDDNGVTQTYDSPGFILLRAYMMEGSHYGDMETSNSESSWKRTGLHSGSSDSNFYTSDWIFEYSLALSKITLGMIRRKFAQFSSIGNVGISLDGDQLVSEGKEEKERLEETLRNEETFLGLGISMG